jgi:hypothetical protein
MKTKLIFSLCLLTGIWMNSVSGQADNQQPVIVFSTGAVALQPDVSMNQFLDFMNRYYQESQKAFPGVTEHMIYGDRGENKYQYGRIAIFDNLDVRDKYYPREDDPANSDAYNASAAKMKAMDQELGKYFAGTNRIYTDWISLMPGSFTVPDGAVVILNTGSTTLKPEVSLNQFRDFYINKYAPEIQKYMPEMKVYLLRGDRGEKKNQIAELWVFDSVAGRDKYWPKENDTNTSPAMKEAVTKLEAIGQEYEKYVNTGGNRVFTDWIVK